MTIVRDLPSQETYPGVLAVDFLRRQKVCTGTCGLAPSVHRTSPVVARGLPLLAEAPFMRSVVFLSAVGPARIAGLPVLSCSRCTSRSARRRSRRSRRRRRRVWAALPGARITVRRRRRPRRPDVATTADGAFAFDRSTPGAVHGRRRAAAVRCRRPSRSTIPPSGARPPLRVVLKAGGFAESLVVTGRRVETRARRDAAEDRDRRRGATSSDRWPPTSPTC